jgi:hypothetical protein
MSLIVICLESIFNPYFLAAFIISWIDVPSFEVPADLVI